MIHEEAEINYLFSFYLWYVYVFRLDFSFHEHFYSLEINEKYKVLTNYGLLNSSEVHFGNIASKFEKHSS